MIDKRYSYYMFVAIMALGMTLAMSFATIIAREGLSSQFFEVWLGASALSFIVAFPTALMISPLARYATDRLTKK